MNIITHKELTINEEDTMSIHCMESTGKAIGSIYLDNVNDGTYIYNLSVEKNYRQKGLGTEMLKYLENLSQQYGRNIVWLVASKSVPFLVNWYKKNGYKVVSNDTEYFRMIKVLKSESTNIGFLQTFKIS